MPFSFQSLESVGNHPKRIVCLSDETTEVLYKFGAQDRIVGVSGFSKRPAEVRSKPRISAFCDADFEAIIALKPDLVLTFSDVQAEISRQLVLRGLTVLNFNQRSIAEILESISMLARVVGKPAEGAALVDSLLTGLAEIKMQAEKLPRRPRVYFEEWHQPLISGIRWVEELVEVAGGEPIFPELLACGKSQDRIVEPAAVVARDPEVIFASWCGMKVDTAAIASRPQWSSISALRNGNLFEINSSIILQPGPAALTEGVKQMHSIIARVAAGDDGQPE
jgi:iron complex transport system substrate-binding protein